VAPISAVAACRLDQPSGELALKVGFLHDQALTQWNGLGLHRGMELLHAGALVLGQPELVTELKDMNRARVPVKLRRQGQAHAAAGAEIGDLLI
jgi:hypothetical protein